MKASKTVTPNAEGKWEYTFENLPKYENGTEIKYTIEEVPVEGYVSDVHGYDVTNTHTPETITSQAQRLGRITTTKME